MYLCARHPWRGLSRTCRLSNREHLARAGVSRPTRQQIQLVLCSVVRRRRRGHTAATAHPDHPDRPIVITAIARRDHPRSEATLVGRVRVWSSGLGGLPAAPARPRVAAEHRDVLARHHRTRARSPTSGKIAPCCVSSAWPESMAAFNRSSHSLSDNSSIEWQLLTGDHTLPSDHLSVEWLRPPAVR